ncbi:MAG: PilN domain-containing protein [Nitrospirae bacterium]|nr:PilN domain-containing protein [Nitrospirota bacterium]
MIRINLLPGPRVKGGPKQADARLEVAAALSLALLTVGVCLYYSSVLDGDIVARQLEKQEKEKQLVALKEKIKQVQDFEQKKKLLEDKNRVIDQLEKSRSGPVHVMDYVSRSIDPLKLWLVRLHMKGNDVELEGKALTNDDVVEFVNNLRRTNYFTNIRLAETRSGSEAKVNLYQFRVNLALKG